MSDTRHKNIQWNLVEGTNGVTYEMVQTALLMDIRDELQRLNALLYCENFIGIPRKLDAIERNTRKPKRKAPHAR